MIWWIIGGYLLCSVLNFFMFLKLNKFVSESVSLDEDDVGLAFLVSLLGPLGFVVTIFCGIICAITDHAFINWLNKHL